MLEEWISGHTCRVRAFLEVTPRSVLNAETWLEVTG